MGFDMKKETLNRLTTIHVLCSVAILFLVGATQAQEGRPIGSLKSPAGELQMAKTLLDQEKYEHALQSLKAFKTNDNYHRMWAHYYSGLAHFALEDYDDGLKEFMAPYDHVRTEIAAKPSQEEFRLAAMALKKVGWFYRHNKDYALAYAYHSIEHQYTQGYGSHLEMHDAAISLDVDAYFLEDPNLSEMWLQKSIISAKNISDSTSKAKALATSFNNLAGTYTKLQRFEDAEELARQAMARWGEFEHRTDQSGNRVIWAYFALGDVYQSWAQSLKDKGENFAEIRDKAYMTFQNGKKQAEAAGMSAEDVKFFTERMEQLEKLTPRE